MAHKRKGQLTPAPQWWKHLRDWKRVANKRERKAAKAEIKKTSVSPRLNDSHYRAQQQDEDSKSKVRSYQVE